MYSSSAVAVLHIYAGGNQWKLRDASDFVSYGNGHTRLEQWASGWRAGREKLDCRARGFPAGLHTPENMCECVFVRFTTQTVTEKIASTPVHTHTQMYSDINRCKSAATPRLFIRHNSYCLFMFTHQYHLFPNEAGRKTRQEMLYRDMHLYTHKHLAHNNILCILRTSSQLSWKSADLHVRGVKPLLLHKKKKHLACFTVICIVYFWANMTVITLRPDRFQAITLVSALSSFYRIQI